MRIVILMLMAAFFIGCTPVREATNVAPKAEKGGFLGLGTKSDIETSGLAAVKGAKRAVVPYFKVAFYTEDNPAGYSNNSGDSVLIHSKLLGVDSKALQRITDAAYVNFAAQMEAKGIDMQPFSALSKSSTYKDFKPAKQYVDSALFGPDATYVTPSGLRMSDAGIFRMKEIGDVLNETGMSVVDVQLNLTYLSQSTDSTLNVVTGISIGQTLTVTPGSKIDFYGFEASKCNGYCPNTVAHAKLGQPVYRAQKLGELRNTTTAGDLTTDALVMAGSWLTTGLKTRNTNRYELHADSEKYEQVAIEVLKEATYKMVNAIAPG